jgi:hypothetical protein
MSQNCANLGSMFVNANRQDSCARFDERTACRGIAWIFHPGRIAGIKQQSENQFQSTLSARHNKDLIRGALRSARRLYVIGNRLTKIRRTPGIAIVKLC